jgi:hypothetical protein
LANHDDLAASGAIGFQIPMAVGADSGISFHESTAVWTAKLLSVHTDMASMASPVGNVRKNSDYKGS